MLSAKGVKQKGTSFGLVMRGGPYVLFFYTCRLVSKPPARSVIAQSPPLRLPQPMVHYYGMR